MTGLLALVAVPLNTLFGVTVAIQITRNEFWGKSFLVSLLDLPFSISPVVAGMQGMLSTCKTSCDNATFEMHNHRTWPCLALCRCS